MPQTTNRPGGQPGAAPTTPIAVTVPGGADITYTAEFVGWLVELAYRQGFDHGVEWASDTMDAAVALAVDPGPQMPNDMRVAVLRRPAKAVVVSLVDAMERETRKAAA